MVEQADPWQELAVLRGEVASLKQQIAGIQELDDAEFTRLYDDIANINLQLQAAQKAQRVAEQAAATAKQQAASLVQQQLAEAQQQAASAAAEVTEAKRQAAAAQQAADAAAAQAASQLQAKQLETDEMARRLQQAQLQLTHAQQAQEAAAAAQQAQQSLQVTAAQQEVSALARQLLELHRKHADTVTQLKEAQLLNAQLQLQAAQERRAAEEANQHLAVERIQTDKTAAQLQELRQQLQSLTQSQSTQTQLAQQVSRLEQEVAQRKKSEMEITRMRNHLMAAVDEEKTKVHDLRQSLDEARQEAGANQAELARLRMEVEVQRKAKHLALKQVKQLKPLGEAQVQATAMQQELEDLRALKAKQDSELAAWVTHDTALRAKLERAQQDLQAERKRARQAERDAALALSASTAHRAAKRARKASRRAPDADGYLHAPDPSPSRSQTSSDSPHNHHSESPRSRSRSRSPRSLQSPSSRSRSPKSPGGRSRSRSRSHSHSRSRSRTRVAPSSPHRPSRSPDASGRWQSSTSNSEDDTSSSEDERGSQQPSENQGNGVEEGELVGDQGAYEADVDLALMRAEEGLQMPSGGATHGGAAVGNSMWDAYAAEAAAIWPGQAGSNGNGLGPGYNPQEVWPGDAAAPGLALVEPGSHFSEVWPGQPAALSHALQPGPNPAAVWPGQAGAPSHAWQPGPDAAGVWAGQAGPLSHALQPGLDYAPAWPGQAGPVAPGVPVGFNPSGVWAGQPGAPSHALQPGPDFAAPWPGQPAASSQALPPGVNPAVWPGSVAGPGQLAPYTGNAPQAPMTAGHVANSYPPPVTGLWTAPNSLPWLQPPVLGHPVYPYAWPPGMGSTQHGPGAQFPLAAAQIQNEVACEWPQEPNEPLQRETGSGWVLQQYQEGLGGGEADRPPLAITAGQAPRGVLVSHPGDALQAGQQGVGPAQLQLAQQGGQQGAGQAQMQPEPLEGVQAVQPQAGQGQQAEQPPATVEPMPAEAAPGRELLTNGRLNALEYLLFTAPSNQPQAGHTQQGAGDDDIPVGESDATAAPAVDHSAVSAVAVSAPAAPTAAAAPVPAAAPPPPAAPPAAAVALASAPAASTAPTPLVTPVATLAATPAATPGPTAAPAPAPDDLPAQVPSASAATSAAQVGGQSAPGPSGADDGFLKFRLQPGAGVRTGTTARAARYLPAVTVPNIPPSATVDAQHTATDTSAQGDTAAAAAAPATTLAAVASVPLSHGLATTTSLATASVIGVMGATSGTVPSEPQQKGPQTDGTERQPGTQQQADVTAGRRERSNSPIQGNASRSPGIGYHARVASSHSPAGRRNRDTSAGHDRRATWSPRNGTSVSPGKGPPAESPRPRAAEYRVSREYEGPALGYSPVYGGRRDRSGSAERRDERMEARKDWGDSRKDDGRDERSAERKGEAKGGWRDEREGERSIERRDERRDERREEGRDARRNERRDERREGRDERRDEWRGERRDERRGECRDERRHEARDERRGERREEGADERRDEGRYERGSERRDERRASRSPADGRRMEPRSSHPGGSWREAARSPSGARHVDGRSSQHGEAWREAERNPPDARRIEPRSSQPGGERWEDDRSPAGTRQLQHRSSQHGTEWREADRSQADARHIEPRSSQHEAPWREATRNPSDTIGPEPRSVWQQVPGTNRKERRTSQPGASWPDASQSVPGSSLMERTTSQPPEPLIEASPSTSKPVPMVRDPSSYSRGRGPAPYLNLDLIGRGNEFEREQERARGRDRDREWEHGSPRERKQAAMWNSRPRAEGESAGQPPSSSPLPRSRSGSGGLDAGPHPTGSLRAPLYNNISSWIPKPYFRPPSLPSEDRASASPHGRNPASLVDDRGRLKRTASQAGLPEAGSVRGSSPTTFMPPPNADGGHCRMEAKPGADRQPRDRQGDVGVTDRVRPSFAEPRSERSPKRECFNGADALMNGHEPEQWNGATADGPEGGHRDMAAQGQDGGEGETGRDEPGLNRGDALNSQAAEEFLQRAEALRPQAPATAHPQSAGHQPCTHLGPPLSGAEREKLDNLVSKGKTSGNLLIMCMLECIHHMSQQKVGRSYGGNKWCPEYHEVTSTLGIRVSRLVGAQYAQVGKIKAIISALQGEGLVCVHELDTAGLVLVGLDFQGLRAWPLWRYGRVPA